MHDIRPFLSTFFNNPGTLLYIGARADAHSWLEELIQTGNEVTILEIWRDNIFGMIGEGWDEKVRFILGNVAELDKAFDTEYDEANPTYDYILYWHGPEHLRYDEIEPTLTKLESKCNRLIALACPWGVYPQGVHKGNPYETHQCSLYPEFFYHWGIWYVHTGKQMNQEAK